MKKDKDRKERNPRAGIRNQGASAAQGCWARICIHRITAGPGDEISEYRRYQTCQKERRNKLCFIEILKILIGV